MYFKYLISLRYSKCSLRIIYSDCGISNFQAASAELANESQYLTGTSFGHFILVSSFDVE